MREGAERLCPYHAEIADAPEADKLGEDAIEYIA
jgi:hypothetical protein